MQKESGLKRTATEPVKHVSFSVANQDDNLFDAFNAMLTSQ